MIGGPARHMLETRKELDDIKTRFFELDELTVGFTPPKKTKKIDIFYIVGTKFKENDRTKSGKLQQRMRLSSYRKRA